MMLPYDAGATREHDEITAQEHVEELPASGCDHCFQQDWENSLEAGATISYVLPAGGAWRPGPQKCPLQLLLPLLVRQANALGVGLSFSFFLT
jgi:hypothetical protein